MLIIIFTNLKLYVIFSVGAKSHPESRCPELLAQYCDSVLRKTRYSENLTPEEVDCKMRNIVSRCIMLGGGGGWGEGGVGIYSDHLEL